ncbi:MAG: putative viral replication protein [Cressdnaviricota sp.]|nr:MAG: putative viral replication protein [Cressdnaviricota sp.]
MSSDSSKSSNHSGGEGNTNPLPTQNKKQISPAIRWCFTLNNYSEDQYSSIVLNIKEKCRLGIIGKETGESGTPHLQGYLEFNTKSRPASAFGIKEIHWEKAKGSKAANIEYCSKDDSSPFCHGCKRHRPLEIIKKTQLYDWQKYILRQIESEPDNRKVLWYWSVEGGVGKTQFCKYLTYHHGAICIHGKGADVRNGVVEYQKANGTTPDLILYPIPRCHGSEYVSYEALENIKDMYFYSGKYEGGMVIGNSPHLIVFANQPPDEDKMSHDRWEIVQIDNFI